LPLTVKKSLVDHGAFIKWVESEVDILRRTARGPRQACGAAIALLPPTTAHRRAAKSAPRQIVMVAKALSGKLLPDRTVAR
jgi:hypothetical protein